MLTLINGLPYFSKQLANDLSCCDSVHKYIFLNTYYSKRDRILFFLLLPFCKQVISFNGVSAKSGSLDWVIRLKKKLIMQWHGTDAMLAVEGFKLGTVDLKYINYAVHFTDATWIREELQTIIPNIEILNFKHVNISTPLEYYESISILCYMSNGREDFYGYDWLLEASQLEEYRHIQFNIIGSDGIDLRKSENIHFHGWLDKEKTNEFLKNSPIFLRLTKHDGNSLIVHEALSYGAEVIWTFPGKNVHYVSNYTEFIARLGNLIKDIESRQMKPNFGNIKFIEQEFNYKCIISNYLHSINK